MTHVEAFKTSGTSPPEATGDLAQSILHGMLRPLAPAGVADAELSDWFNALPDDHEAVRAANHEAVRFAASLNGEAAGQAVRDFLA